jgi:bifunctional DNA-binding transcriptional regulator/antitoxin component of YhaV-PrlF toxin-antitoxin module
VIKTPQTENRKIIRIGKTSLGVILPKAWLRYFAIKAGDKVEVTSNGQVTIKPLLKQNGPTAPEMTAA